MSNKLYHWLAKITGQQPPVPPASGQTGGKLAVRDPQNSVGAYQPQPQLFGPPRKKKLTNAAMVYALGAGVLAVLTIDNLASGHYFNGIVMIIPTLCLFGLAYRYLE